MVFSLEDTTSTEKKQLFVVLKTDGNEYIGYILKDDGREVLLETENLGKIYIPKSQIKNITKVEDEKLIQNGYYNTEGPFTTRYTFTTNALPIKKGEDYALVNLYGPEVHFAVSDNFNIGVMTTWIASPLVVAMKYSFKTRNENINLSAGLLAGTSGYLNGFRGYGGLAFGNITFGDRRRNLTIAGGYLFVEPDVNFTQGIYQEGVYTNNESSIYNSNAPVKVEEKYRDLFLMNDTKSHKQVLTDDEYEVESEVNGLQIIAKSYFRKPLPFVKKLNAYEDRLTFNGDTLSAFGALYFDEDIKETISIQYYNNDDDFILALQPKNEEHQIFLYLPRKFHPTLKEAATVLKEKILNRADLKDREAWKYSLNDDDEVLVPKFAFNIENEFDSIIGNLFKAGNLEYIVDKVYQRNAFVLDENGAEIESEALVQVSEGRVLHPKIYPPLKSCISTDPFTFSCKEKMPSGLILECGWEIKS